MLMRIPRRFLICTVLLSATECAYAQLLEWAPCAATCITQVTTPVESCQQGFRCFCSDQTLYNDAIDCWQANCTIREALSSQNITSLTCGFPDRDIGPSGTAVTFASMGVSLVFVVMQLLVFATTRAWGWDDILIAVATIAMIGNAICNPFARAAGFGKDAWRIPFDDSATILQIFYAGGIVYVFGVAVTKMAFLCFYIRLFPTSRVRRVAYPLLAIAFAEGVVFVFLFAFQCTPIEYTWLQWDGEAEGKCLGFEIGAALHAIVNIVLDFAIFALPIFQIRSLNLSKKKRWQVLMMFAVGFFVTLVSALRIPSLIAVGSSKNLSRDYIPLGYWSDLELNIGIACFCMPAARVILRRYFPSCGLSTTVHSDSYGARQTTAMGSSGAGGAIHRKKISNGKVVDVTIDDETGQIVPRETQATVSDLGGSTLRDSEWPLPNETTGQNRHTLDGDQQAGLVSKLPRGHAPNRDRAASAPQGREYRDDGRGRQPDGEGSESRGARARSAGKMLFTHSQSHLQSPREFSSDDSSEEIEMVYMPNPVDGKGGSV